MLGDDDSDSDGGHTHSSLSPIASGLPGSAQQGNRQQADRCREEEAEPRGIGPACVIVWSQIAGLRHLEEGGRRQILAGFANPCQEIKHPQQQVAVAAGRPARACLRIYPVGRALQTRPVTQNGTPFVAGLQSLLYLKDTMRASTRLPCPRPDVALAPAAHPPACLPPENLAPACLSPRNLAQEMRSHRDRRPSPQRPALCPQCPPPRSR
jgi:hypothetical protein